MKKLYLGGPLFQNYDDPDKWITNLKAVGYRAAYSPVDIDSDEDVINNYKRAAKKSNIIIAEVGVWNNPISPDETERKRAIDLCCRKLYLADIIEACCCVNVSGSIGEDWAGPYRENLLHSTFDLIVETVQKIIDEVQPIRTYYTLEPMPWAFPNSADSYLKLIKAVNRKQFAVHFDPVNVINSPDKYFFNDKYIKEWFKKLGAWIKSCHAKDIFLQNKLTTHLNEVRPGLGNLDYQTFLIELSHLHDVPLMLEHLSSSVEYKKAGDYIRSIGRQIGIHF